MGSEQVTNKPHVVCVTLPFQSHIKAMLKLAKLLHHRGFHITFVNTEFNHKRFLKTLGPNSLDGLPDFRFETIPDGLPSSDEDASQDVGLLCESIRKNFLAPFHGLLTKLKDLASTSDISPPVTHIVSDGWNAYVLKAAEKHQIPVTLFFTMSASSIMAYAHFPTLREKGLAPLKDESCLTNGYLDKVIDWIPAMKDIRLRDLPTNFQVTDPDDSVWNFVLEAFEGLGKAEAVVLHTFDALEPDVIEALSSMLRPRVYVIGPLQSLLNHIPTHPLDPIGYSLWKEETECLQWLNSKAPNSVVYVNFGSIMVMTSKQLIEFAWGLANTKLPFFWVIRPDLVAGESAILPPEFVAETKERGLIASWCPQEQVLNHPAVGGFLTHSGWNSVIESVNAGVPMICWPFFSDQQTNTWSACNKWGIGVEIMSNDVKRDEIEKLVKEVMEGEKGKKLRNKAMEWKKLAEEATGPHGSSATNLDNLVNQLLP
ncbi:PREDICTED: 7-deoxyloganetin glucosyltransferase-like [Fragaria vesca subsp. vesca]|uniref:7-deoxyloganetin glucosyltransferase-like n=1 Tax=Fragaria vesca subsp. vesca TaxID=101020 RepID=UPI0002C37004|nr:PREDICTED: 7-deoxyloganetin glucosyltransferase-like [Fragaria vesca subsp. vesca]